jgi:hypothetical protein
MPAVVLPDIDAQVWNAMEAGDEATARKLLSAKLILENALESVRMRRARKMVLARRGVIAETSTYGRGQAKEALDAVDLAELEHGLEAVAPYFIV